MIQAPRDCVVIFEPQIVSKCQIKVCGVTDKILDLYVKWLSICAISKILEEIYGFETFHKIISSVTDKMIPLIQEWQRITLNW